MSDMSTGNYGTPMDGWTHYGHMHNWACTPPALLKCRGSFHTIQAIPTAKDQPYEFCCFVCRAKWLAPLPGFPKEGK